MLHSWPPLPDHSKQYLGQLTLVHTSPHQGCQVSSARASSFPHPLLHAQPMLLPLICTKERNSSDQTETFWYLPSPTIIPFGTRGDPFSCAGRNLSGLRHPEPFFLVNSLLPLCSLCGSHLSPHRLFSMPLHRKPHSLLLSVSSHRSFFSLHFLSSSLYRSQ